MATTTTTTATPAASDALLKRWDTLVRLLPIQATQAKASFDLLLNPSGQSNGAPPSPSSTRDPLDPLSKFGLLFATLKELLITPFPSAFEDAPPSVSFEARFESFLSWLRENGCYASKVRLASGLTEGNGVVATQEVAEGELIVKIPQKLMITAQSALEVPAISQLLQSDQLVKSMPNLLVALQLLYERHTQKTSFWAPYLRVLPQTYQTIFYMDIDDLAALRGSPTFLASLRIITTNALQYAHLAKLIKDSEVWPKKVLTYGDWIWAMSALSSRQNPVPIDGKTTLGLIPFFDMFNHTVTGKITSFFNSEDRTLECHAPKSYQPGEQVQIFYGDRPNSDFFLFSGFVIDDNPHDFFKIQLVLSSQSQAQSQFPELLSAKQKALRAHNIPEGEFHLIPDGPTEDLLKFARLAALQDIAQVREFTGAALSASHEDSALEYICNTCIAQLKKYPTSIQEDEQLLKGEGQSASAIRQQAIRLRLAEKRLLQGVVEKLTSRLQKRKKQQNKRKNKKKGQAGSPQQ